MSLANQPPPPGSGQKESFISRITEFWNKSRSNKVILLIAGVIIISCCCVFTPKGGNQPTTPAISAEDIKSTAESDAWTSVAQTQIAGSTPTPAETSTPAFTATSEFTPTATNTPGPTIDFMRSLKVDGFYLVNVDIAPGVWRSVGSGDACYWATTTQQGDVINNHFGQAGGTAYIAATAFQVEFNGCGDWEYLSPP